MALLLLIITYLILYIIIYSYDGKFIIMEKTALITGVTGQDRSYLGELFLSKKYEVYSIIKRTCMFCTAYIHRCLDPHGSPDKLFLHYGDLSSVGQFPNFFCTTQSKYTNHLDTRSHGLVSSDTPEDSRDVIGLVPLEFSRLFNEAEFPESFPKPPQANYLETAHLPSFEDTPFYHRSPCWGDVRLRKQNFVFLLGASTTAVKLAQITNTRVKLKSFKKESSKKDL